MTVPADKTYPLVVMRVDIIDMVAVDIVVVSAAKNRCVVTPEGISKAA